MVFGAIVEKAAPQGDEDSVSGNVRLWTRLRVYALSP
jgi:hypothetical protein